MPTENVRAHEKLEGLEEIAARDHGALRLRVLAPTDRMKLFIEATPRSESGSPVPVGPVPLTRVDLLGLLPKSLRTELIHSEVLDDVVSLISQGKPISPARRVARGREPVPGRDGKLVLLVKAYQPSGPKEVIDPWFFKAFDPIEVGTNVARIYLPHPGTPGLNCVGEKPPAPEGKPIAIGSDESITIQDQSGNQQFQVAIAKVSGFLQVEKGSLRVVHTLSIGGNVDHHSGDIIFPGPVQISGDVMKDFRVQAREAITVKGSVVHGRLITESGDITINGTVTGDPSHYISLRERMPVGSSRPVSPASRVQISSAGTLQAHALDGVTAEARGNIIINREIRASMLHTRASVLIPNGHILGGEIHAVCGVEAKIFGTESGVTTKITLCSDIESTAEYEALVAQLTAHASAVEMLHLYLGPYAELPARIPHLPPDLRKKMETLFKKLTEVKRSQQKLRESQEEFLKRAHSNTVYRINILKTCYGGVVFCAGEACMTVHETIHGKKTIEFLQAEGRFEIGELKPLECSVASEPNVTHSIGQQIASKLDTKSAEGTKKDPKSPGTAGA